MRLHAEPSSAQVAGDLVRNGRTIPVLLSSLATLVCLVILLLYSQQEAVGKSCRIQNGGYKIDLSNLTSTARVGYLLTESDYKLISAKGPPFLTLWEPGAGLRWYSHRKRNHTAEDCSCTQPPWYPFRSLMFLDNVTEAFARRRIVFRVASKWSQDLDVLQAVASGTDVSRAELTIPCHVAAKGNTTYAVSCFFPSPGRFSLRVRVVCANCHPLEACAHCRRVFDQDSWIPTEGIIIAKDIAVVSSIGDEPFRVAPVTWKVTFCQASLAEVVSL